MDIAGSEPRFLDNRSGHLSSVAQEMQRKPKVDISKLKLKTFISKDQREKGKKLVEASSGDYCEFTDVEV